MTTAPRGARRIESRVAVWAVALVCVLAAEFALAATTVTIRDTTGRAVAGAGVAVEIAGGAGSVAGPLVAVMDQKDEQFVPDFLVVRTGTEVSFPNSDQVLHHVYSFSPARVFELPLYRGVLPSPVRFEREGIVTIGCNIHDHMVGHIWVVGTPVFALTDSEGRAALRDVPAGTHRLLAWHPLLGRAGVVTSELVVGSDGGADTGLVLAIARPRPGNGALAWHADY
jgi:plastocyanin